MARKEAFITITADGDDKGKVFKLTRMPAMQAAKWAARAFLALARGGVEIPEDIASSGLMGIAMLGMKMFGSMRWEDAEPLLDELFACVQAVPDPSRPELVTKIFESSIEEPATIALLHKEAFCLHVDFSKLAAPLTSALAAGKPTSSPNT